MTAIKAIYKDFCLFNFYSKSEGITTQSQAQEAMNRWIIQRMKNSDIITLEVPRTTDSGFTAGLIIQTLGRVYNINLSTNTQEEFLIITIANKPKEKRV